MRNGIWKVNRSIYEIDPEYCSEVVANGKVELRVCNTAYTGWNRVSVVKINIKDVFETKQLAIDECEIRNSR